MEMLVRHLYGEVVANECLPIHVYGYVLIKLTKV